MKKKMVFALTGVLAGMTVLGGCGGTEEASNDTADTQKESEGEDAGTEEAEDTGSGETVEITYTSRGNADEIKVYQQAVDAFNEAQDEVHVTFEASPSDGYNQQLITQLAGGTAADVIFVEDTIISQLVNNGTIADLTDFLATEDSYVKAEDFDDSVWGASKKDDRIYGLSVDCNPVLLYYSPSMLEELAARIRRNYLSRDSGPGIILTRSATRWWKTERAVWYRAATISACITGYSPTAEPYGTAIPMSSTIRRGRRSNICAPACRMEDSFTAELFRTAREKMPCSCPSRQDLSLPDAG